MENPTPGTVRQPDAQPQARQCEICHVPVDPTRLSQRFCSEACWDRWMKYDKSNKTLEKWRERSKNIQDCHYDTAATLKLLHYATGMTLVILTAISASNIWADAEMFDLFKPYSKLTDSFIALLIAVLSAVQAFLGFEKRSELHSIAGTKYGEIKREIEITPPSDEADLLPTLYKKWSALTAESPIIPLRIWNKNEKKKEEKERKEKEKEKKEKEKKEKKPDITPTHAGGVVIFREGATILYLVVEAKNKPDEWVLPKGHIEGGESMAQAARREVLEETGVDAVVRDILNTVEFSTPNEPVKAQFFLMEAVSKEGPPREGRESRWLTFDVALEALQFTEAQGLVIQANTLLRHTTGLTGSGPSKT